MPSTEPILDRSPRGIDKKAESIRRMFDSIARRYDAANHWLSLGVDRRWRKRLRRRLAAFSRQQPFLLLDVCCGTGDLAFELCRLGSLTAVDFSHSMLQQARRKAESEPLTAAISWLEADALQLPFPAGTFDLASVAFGIRNFERLDAGLEEIIRVLKPEGILAILEFSMPRCRWFATIYRFYFERILPLLGGWITGRPEAYRYLPASVSLFPRPEEISGLLKRYGMNPLTVEGWTGGMVTCYLAQKRSAPPEATS